MNHVMLAVSGFSGSGKDEFVSGLRKTTDLTQVGLVDPAKRHMAEIYGFTKEQLFGPSKNRNAGDTRYPKTKAQEDGIHRVQDMFVDRAGNLITEGDPNYWLSPREALQKYCELMNLLYPNTWIRKAIDTHQMVGTGNYLYDSWAGLTPHEHITRTGLVVTVSADFRHLNEFEELDKKTDMNVYYVRIKTKRVPYPPFNHRSETEQVQIPDSRFDFIVDNDGTIEDLHARAANIMSEVQKKL